VLSALTPRVLRLSRIATMAMTYETRQAGDVTILDISGKIDIGVALAFGPGGSMPLQTLIRDLAQSGHKNVLLNLREVIYLDSSGIGELVRSVTTLRKMGGDLKVVNPNMVVKKLLSATRVDSVLEVRADEASALEAFSKTAPQKA